jgi:hypothetical protein
LRAACKFFVLSTKRRLTEKTSSPRVNVLVYLDRDWLPELKGGLGADTRLEAVSIPRLFNQPHGGHLRYDREDAQRISDAAIGS